MQKIKLLSIALVSSFLLSSCFTYTTVVGDGAKEKNEVKKWNNYFLWGLADGTISDPAELRRRVQLQLSRFHCALVCRFAASLADTGHTLPESCALPRQTLRRR